jgi:ATP-dependent Clp protease, protease subunit
MSYSPEETPPKAPSRLVNDHLFAARTVLVFGEITTALAETVSAQLLAMADRGDEPIRMVVNSQGGHVESADTLFDMVRFVRPTVLMLGTGWVASAGALIYSAVPRARRMALANTRFMLHQPLGGVRGPATDVEIEAEQILSMRRRLSRIFAEATGQSLERIEKDTDRNYWMNAEQAKAYGLVGEIVQSADALTAPLAGD